MKSEEIYNAWKNGKSQIEIGKGFSDRVLKQIHQYEQGKRARIFDMQQFLEFISLHPLAKAALIATGAVAGVVRLVFMIIMILSKGDING
jgi:hypothetical protein